MNKLTSLYFIGFILLSLGFEHSPKGEIRTSRHIANTSATLREFLRADKTNENAFLPGYNCANFAWDLMTSANEYGIPMYIVTVGLEDSVGHALNAIDTVDKGTIFIEPQTDKIYLGPVVGSPLCVTENDCIFGEHKITRLSEYYRPLPYRP